MYSHLNGMWLASSTPFVTLIQFLPVQFLIAYSTRWEGMGAQLCGKLECDSLYPHFGDWKEAN